MAVPDARVAFCGALLFIGCHPYPGDGDLGDLRVALGRLEACGADRFVPGHGPVGGVTEVRALARHLDDVEGFAARGGDPAARGEDPVARGEDRPAIPDPYRSWGFARFLPANVEFCAGGGKQPEASAEEPSG